MASNAAMLLDPRAYRKQLQSNGNDPDFPSEYSNSDENATSQVMPERVSPPAISTRSASSGDEDEDEDISDAESHTDSHLQGTGRHDDDDSRSDISSAAPAGTISAAHHLLDPRRRQRGANRGAKSSSRSKSSRSSSVASAESSESIAESKPDIDVEFDSAQVENGNDSKRDFEQVEDESQGARRNLIEDIYGVERRENHPYKKMKVENGEKAKSAKSAQFSAGESGLGEYMKEEGKPGTSSVVTPDLVDLTARKSPSEITIAS